MTTARFDKTAQSIQQADEDIVPGSRVRLCEDGEEGGDQGHLPAPGEDHAEHYHAGGCDDAEQYSVGGDTKHYFAPDEDYAEY